MPLKGNKWYKSERFLKYIKSMILALYGRKEGKWRASGGKN
jgi:hypothetical protein